VRAVHTNTRALSVSRLRRWWTLRREGYWALHSVNFTAWSWCRD